jgi:hypothetical protein
MKTPNTFSIRRRMTFPARTSAIVWEDSAEMKKQGLEDAAYR